MRNNVVNWIANRNVWTLSNGDRAASLTRSSKGNLATNTNYTTTPQPFRIRPGLSALPPTIRPAGPLNLAELRANRWHRGNLGQQKRCVASPIVRSYSSARQAGPLMVLRQNPIGLLVISFQVSLLAWH